jgi:glycerol kinase
MPTPNMTADMSLLLDIGGQGCRALAVDGDGIIQFEAYRAVSTREDGSRVEQGAEEIAEAIEAVTVETLREMDEQSMPIVQAALAVQRGSIVCWDRLDGAALSPVISWRDRRGLAGMERLADRAEEFRQRTGLRFSPYGGASKIAWCLNELADVQKANEHDRLVCGPLGSFVLARLLDEKSLQVDDSLAQRTLLWSRETCDWDPWLLKQFGLSSRMLPKVVPSHFTHGHLRQENGQVPINLLLGDQNCVPFLDGTPDADTLYINLGTGAFVLRPLREPVDDERFQLTLLDRDHEGRWALEGSVHGAASAISWLERQEQCSIGPEQMKGLRERVPNPPLFINSIDGLGSPWWCQGPEPDFIGQHERHDTDARLRAVVESIAFLIRACVDAMNESVDPPSRLVLSGGLSRSATVCSLITDLLDIETLRLDSAEGTAMGLWCRLNGRALNADQFSAIRRGCVSGLEERYTRWLKYMP